MRIPQIVTLNEVKGLGEGRCIFIHPTTRFFVASLLRMTRR